MTTQTFEAWLGTNKAILMLAMVRTGDRFERDFAELAWQAQQERIDELEKDNLDAYSKYLILEGDRQSMKRQLVLSQLHNKQLVEALERFIEDAQNVDVGGGDYVATTCESLEIAQKALSTPPDISALDAYVESKCKVVGYVNQDNLDMESYENLTFLHPISTKKNEDYTVPLFAKVKEYRMSDIRENAPVANIKVKPSPESIVMALASAYKVGTEVALEWLLNSDFNNVDFDKQAS